MNWGLLRPVLALGIVLALLAGPATAKQARIALVIGNSEYVNVGALANPKNDARLISTALREVGFEVTTLTDANRRSIVRAIQKFGRRLDRAGKNAVGLFYFAGHGVQALGSNYLIPIGAAIQSEADLQIEAVNASWVLGQMEYAGNGLNIVVLDACRNNPFKRSFRSSERGLARMNAPRGSLLAYAAAPGQVASDGKGTVNSPYTSALAKHIRMPGVQLEDVFKQVRIDVERATDGQVPWEESSLRGDFYFIAPKARITVNTTPATTPTGTSNEALFWQSIKDSEDTTEFELYLERFPKGFFSDLARHKLDRLKRQSAKVTTGDAPVTGPAPHMVEATLALTREERILIQQGLNGLGYDSGTADGLFGRGTRTALRKYQAARKIAVTGFLTADQAKELLKEGRRPKSSESTLKQGHQAYHRKDYATALRIYRQLAAKGDAIAQYSIGYLYHQGKGVSKDPREALDWYRKAAAQGNLYAEYRLGTMYLDGVGVPKNYYLALDWYRKSAAQNYAPAQYDLGWMYEFGKGVKKSYATALSWYQKGAAKGNLPSQYKMGRAYQKGRGVAVNYGTALDWYRKAAAKGHVGSQHQLGWMYQKGLGVRVNYHTALEWYRKSAAKNDSSSQFQIGWLYEYGLGVRRDYDKAMEWYRKSAAQNNAGAKKAVTALRRKMSGK